MKYWCLGGCEFATQPGNIVRRVLHPARKVGYIYLFSWHVIGIFIFLWFVINILNFSWSVNRQLAVNCDCIVLFTVNGDCLSENPVNCDPNITCDTWFRLLSVKFCIRRIDQNVPILMIFSHIFRGACPRKPPPLRFRSYTGLIHHRSPHLICKPRGVDRSGIARVNELLNEWINQGDEDWVTVGPLIMKYYKSLFSLRKYRKYMGVIVFNY